MSQASAHKGDQQRSQLAKAAVDVELLPLTVWLTAGLVQRMGSVAALMQQQQQQALPTPALQQPAVLPAVLQGADVTAAVHATRVCVVLPLALQPPCQTAAASPGHGAAAGASAAARGPELRPSCMFVALELHSGSSSSSSSSSSSYAAAAAGHHHHHQHHGHPRYGHPAGQQYERQPVVLRAAAAAAIGRALPLLQLSSAPAAAAAGGPAGSLQQQGAVAEVSLTRLRLFHVTQLMVVSSSSSSSTTSLRAAAAAAAASKASSSASSSMLLQQQQQGYSLSRLLRRQQKHPQADTNAGHSSGGGSQGSGIKLAAECVLDAGPAAAPLPAAASPAAPPVNMAGSYSSGSSSGHSSMGSSGVAAAGLGFGPDDVPWGSALYATITWDPAARPDAAAVAEAAALAAAHAKDRGEGADDDCDTYYAGYDGLWPPTPPAAEAAQGARGPQTAGAGAAAAAAAAQGNRGAGGCSSQFGVLKFQHRCQKGSSVVVHARAPAVTGFLGRDRLVTLLTSVVAAAAAGTAQAGQAHDSSTCPAAPSSSQQRVQQQLVQQVAVLLQCRLHLCLQSVVQQQEQQQHHQTRSGQSSHHHNKHSYHVQHTHHHPPHGHNLQQPVQPSSGHNNHSSSSSSSDSPAPSPSIELLADDLSLFSVKGLGGCAAATAVCLCVQGLQLYTGSPSKGTTAGSQGCVGTGGTGNSRICGLLVPKHSKTTGPPGLEVLQVLTGSSSSSSSSSSSTGTGSTNVHTARSSSSRVQDGARRTKPVKHVTYAPAGPAAAAGGGSGAAGAAAGGGVRQGILSVLLRGATLSMDPGGLSLDWINHLTDFFGPVAAAVSAAPVQQQQQQQQQQDLQQSKQPQQQVLVLNLQDFAVRCEPRNDGPSSHNSSRMAAALVLDGAHWQLNPGPAAPQHLLLHSLGFYVAAAAARSVLTPGASSGGSGTGSIGSSSRGKGVRGLGVWDPAVPVDLHGFSLSAAGYHCIAQEGGLGVIIRPAAAAPAAAPGGPTSSGTL